MGIDRYRGLKGFARHVLPGLEVKRSNRSRAALNAFGPIRRYDGHCRWCGGKTDYGLGYKRARPRAWHLSCLPYYFAATGVDARAGVWATDGAFHAAYPITACAECGRDDLAYRGRGELDHRVAIALAARQGLREYARAFLPDNLQWLCSDCHKAKTASDVGAMAALDRPEVEQRRLDRLREAEAQRERLQPRLLGAPLAPHGITITEVVYGDGRAD